MAKRFGRNQRRQLRQQIAELDSQLNAASARIDYLQETAEHERRRIEGWKRRVISAVGQKNMLSLERNVGSFSNYGSDRFMYTEMPFPLTAGPMDDIPSSVTCQQMEAAVMYVESYADEYTDLVSFQLRGGGTKTAWAANRDKLKTIVAHDDQFRLWVADQILKELETHL